MRHKNLFCYYIRIFSSKYFFISDFFIIFVISSAAGFKTDIAAFFEIRSGKTVLYVFYVIIEIFSPHNE